MKFDIKDGGVGRAIGRGRKKTWADLLPPHLQALQLQDDMSVANGPGATVRVDMNNQFQSLATMNSGAAAPGTTYGNLLWADTTNTLSKKRNNANGAWNTFANLDWTQWQLNDGTAGAPSYSWNADPDNGLYRIGANNWGGSAGGSKVFDVSSTGFGVTGKISATSTNTAWMFGDASYSYFANTSTGSSEYLLMDGTNHKLYLGTNNSSRLTIDGSGNFTVPAIYTGTTATAANVAVNSSGDLNRSTSSLKYKTDLVDLTLEEARKVTFKLHAFSYSSASPVDNPADRWVGYGAEEIDAIDRRFVSHDSNGLADGVAYERFVVPHGLILDNHEARIAALESATIH